MGTKCTARTPAPEPAWRNGRECRKNVLWRIGTRRQRMAEVINLNKARKRKARQDATVRAAGNRVRFGRSKEQKQRDAALTEEARRRLDALLREEPREDQAED